MTVKIKVKNKSYELVTESELMFNNDYRENSNNGINIKFYRVGNLNMLNVTGTTTAVLSKDSTYEFVIPEGFYCASPIAYTFIEPNGYGSFMINGKRVTFYPSKDISVGSYVRGCTFYPASSLT
jgi:hypothetical protein